MMNTDVTIELSQNSLANSQIVQNILSDLPEWFGLPESTQSYVDEAKSLPLWVAKIQGKPIGFIDLNETSSGTAEISCMGVLKQHQHLGIGTQLVAELTKFAKTRYQYLQVKTVDEGHYRQYDDTIRFYESVGFTRLEVFPHLWDEWNPCLIMVKYLGS
nr:GNAT family N-acetyltransferase [Lacticaseibacillus hulanensis]